MKKSLLLYKTKPYKHQKQDLINTIDKPYYAHFWEMGTGKSKLIIDLSCNLYNQDKIRAVLIVAPNNVHRNWTSQEIPVHASIPYKAGYWSGGNHSKKYKKELQDLFDSKRLIFFAMNYEAFPTKRGYAIAEYFVKRFFCLFVLDESHKIKNNTAQRTKQLLKLANHPNIVSKRILTGTPVTGSPLDLFNQFNFLSEDILFFRSFYSFKHHYAKIEKTQTFQKTKKHPKGWIYEKIIGFKNLNELRKKIGPYITRKTKEECLDLPEKIYQRLPIQMTKKQKDIYDEMEKNLSLEFDMSTRELRQEIANFVLTGIVTCKISLTKFLRLRQIISNFVMTDTGETIVIDEDCNPKLNALLEDLKDTFEPFKNNKIIIWASFRYEIFLITEILQKLYGKEVVASYFGDTKKEDRIKIIKLFQNLDPNKPGKVTKKSKLRILVSNPASGGMGIDLTAASLCYYFSNSYDAEHRWQSEDRAHRIGQKNIVIYKDIVAENTIDGKVHKVLILKGKIAKQVID